MTFTFAEWNLIRQAVTQWAERSEECFRESKPSEEKLSCYQIFKRQSAQLRALEEKINNTVI